MNIKEQAFQQMYEIAVKELRSAINKMIDEDGYDSPREDELTNAFEGRLINIGHHYGLHIRMRMWMDEKQEQAFLELKPTFSGAVGAVIGSGVYLEGEPPDMFFFELLEDAVIFKMMMSSHGEVWRL